ncbi:synaptotagmin-7-like isoform X2 [Montipora foliosa]|uniref:synaptotagmin-7-like isoform X2 n=1 Tax=Montipora foliosa TaxID=591990 RepID=UPI0035F144FA
MVNQVFLAVGLGLVTGIFVVAVYFIIQYIRHRSSKNFRPRVIVKQDIPLFYIPTHVPFELQRPIGTLERTESLKKEQYCNGSTHMSPTVHHFDVRKKADDSGGGNLEESEDSGGESSSVDSFFALGELLISLCYNPSDQKLNVKIISARGLQPIANGTVNPFVKLDVTFCGRKLSSRSTKTEHHTLAPNFCELFVIDMKPEKLNQVTLIFKVKHRGRMRDVCIGTVHLGYCVHVEGEYRHWEQSMEKPHMEIEYWHPIQEQFVD